MRSIDINQYTYELPSHRIATYPLPVRDQSKLLFYEKRKVKHYGFRSLPDLLPQNSLLLFNDTKVIPARMFFEKETGATVEIFLLNPSNPVSVAEAMQTHGICTWKCTIGNLKRWTEDKKLKKRIKDIELTADLTDRQESIVKFTWNSSHSFAELISMTGETPLPPYIKRKAEASDRDRYQTVYSHYEGAVAAPTAGLHFTNDIMNSLKQRGIETDFLTLHVSAGTFQPIKVANALDHTMHSEQIVVSRNNIENLLREKFIVAVGTTSLRTLESIYWYGTKLLQDQNAAFDITQLDPNFTASHLPSKQEAIRAVASHMDDNLISSLAGSTSIYIVPGYSFRICDALITNFHQPGSTLILLVAAFVGEDWKKIYNEALEHDYRFLSYGDSSLLIR